MQNSASQTLSDLAQAASNQLMAENNATGDGSGGSSGGARPRVTEASLDSSRESSLERDDPLLSDHPYGLPSYQMRMRRLMDPANGPSATVTSSNGTSDSSIPHLKYVNSTLQFTIAYFI